MSREESNVEMNNVAELLKILIKLNMSESQSISFFVNHINGMEKQFQSVMEELSTVKEQLANMQNKSTTQTEKPVKSTLINLNNLQVQQIFDDKVSSMQEIFQNTKATLNERAGQLVKNFKEKGIIALNNVCGFLGIKDSMINLKDSYEQSANEMQGSIDKINMVSKELRETATHAKNIGRAVSGKELIETPEQKQSGFLHILKKPYQKMKNIFNGGAEKLREGITKLEALEKSAERITDNREKSSISERLKENKTSVQGQEKREKNNTIEEKAKVQQER